MHGQTQQDPGGGQESTGGPADDGPPRCRQGAGVCEWTPGEVLNCKVFELKACWQYSGGGAQNVGGVTPECCVLSLIHQSEQPN